MEESARTLGVVDLGRIEYGQAWKLQQRAADAVRTGSVTETLMLVEHPPVYTIGRGAHGSAANLLWDADQRRAKGIELYQVDRGGDITYHGPGQLVVYPILDLNRHYSRDLHRYLRDLEEAIIQALAKFGVAARRFPPHTGVWVEEAKVAAIGVKASRWITQHGLALNVNPDMSHFAGIIPCGIDDYGVTSLEQLLGTAPTMDRVKPVLVDQLAQCLRVDVLSMDSTVWMKALAATETEVRGSQGGIDSA